MRENIITSRREEEKRREQNKKRIKDYKESRNGKSSKEIHKNSKKSPKKNNRYSLTSSS